MNEYQVRPMNLNCLSYWFPRLQAAGLPVPRTEVVHASPDAIAALYRPFDGQAIGPGAKDFLAELRAAVESIGVPCFLRTGQGSGKHQWDDCCNLTSVAALEHHVLSLIQWSDFVDMIGLPVDVWAVREFLPTMPVMVADRYGNMPVCREFRFFVDGAKVLCRHPYWSKDSLEQGLSELPTDFAERYERLCHDVIELATIHDLASRAGAALGGYWSVDILETERGWFVTDAAEGQRSFHWEGCSANP